MNDLDEIAYYFYKEYSIKYGYGYFRYKSFLRYKHKERYKEFYNKANKKMRIDKLKSIL